MRGIPCGSVKRRGVGTSWQGVPLVHQSGNDVRRRGPAEIAAAERSGPAASAARADVAQESRDE